MIALENVERWLSRFPDLDVALVGDLFLDRYLEIEPDWTELSLETGLEAYQVSGIRNCPGALGTVMNNLAALGVGHLRPVTVIGDDGHGVDLLRALEQLPVDLDGVLRDPARLTPTYTKPLFRQRDGWREGNRLDVRTRAPLSHSLLGELCACLRRAFDAADGLIVLDQLVREGEGIVAPPVRDFLAELADRSPEKLMFVDSRAHIAKFQRGILKTNDKEYLSSANLAPTCDLQEIAQAVRQRAWGRAEAVVCTLGEHGMLVAEPGQEPVHVRGYKVQGPLDVVGAGDSATSGIVASLLAGASLVEAAAMGNLVASITVQQLGTTGTATPEQVRGRWRECYGNTRHRSRNSPLRGIRDAGPVARRDDCVSPPGSASILVSGAEGQAPPEGSDGGT